MTDRHIVRLMWAIGVFGGASALMDFTVAWIAWRRG